MKFTVTALREANTQTHTHTDKHAHSWTLSINKRESKKLKMLRIRPKKMMHAYILMNTQIIFKIELNKSFYIHAHTHLQSH